LVVPAPGLCAEKAAHFFANGLPSSGTTLTGTMEQPAEKLVSHHIWLRRLARRMVRSSASADDLVQDTCITALRNAPPDVQMRPWLRSVMRKLAWGHARSEERRAQREEIFYQTTPPISEPDALLEYGVDRARLAEAVETLPEPFRSTVVQRFVEGRSCAEIARAEQVPAGTVRWRQTRALELLRNELAGARGRTRARRRHVIWGLPIFGAGERIITHVGQSLFSLAQSKATWLVLACLAAAFGLGLLRDPAHHQQASAGVPAGAHARHASGASLHALAHGQHDRSDRAELLLTHGAPRLRGSGPFSPAGDPIAGGDEIDADEMHQRRRVLEAARHAYEPLLDDCELDPEGFVRCHKPPMNPNDRGRPTCDSINHNLAFIDITRRLNFMTHPYANRFLLAAMIANLALGTSLGCSLVTDSGGADTKNVAPHGGGANCETQEGPDGEVCATCTDSDGAATTMCAPSDCYVQTEPDGAVCTTCTDIHGSKKTVCEDAPPKDCVSEVQGFGLLCTTCTEDGQPVTTCSPAACGVSNRCLECEDPRGNTGTDCSLDYEAMYTASATYGDGDTFNSCTTSWGVPSGSSTSCHYPGVDTCTLSESADARCIDCTYPSGGGKSLCLFDPNDPTPDPFAGRPANLPAPGVCVDETSADGSVVCTTCTRQDLSATTTCRHPAAESCDFVESGDHTACVRCTHADGSSVAFCDPLTL
jgi:RNA polymerase sigma-70 factor (ECF subfamily)